MTAEHLLLQTPNQPITESSVDEHKITKHKRPTLKLSRPVIMPQSLYGNDAQEKSKAKP